MKSLKYLMLVFCSALLVCCGDDVEDNDIVSPYDISFYASGYDSYVDSDGGVIILNVETEGRWRVSSTCPGVEFDQTSGTGKASFTVTIPSNPEYESREIVFILTDEDLGVNIETSVTQKAGGVYCRLVDAWGDATNLRWNSCSLYFDKNAQTLRFRIETNVPLYDITGYSLGGNGSLLKPVIENDELVISVTSTGTLMSYVQLRFVDSSHGVDITRDINIYRTDALHFTSNDVYVSYQSNTSSVSRSSGIYTCESTLPDWLSFSESTTTYSLEIGQNDTGTYRQSPISFKSSGGSIVTYSIKQSPVQ